MFHVFSVESWNEQTKANNQLGVMLALNTARLFEILGRRLSR